MARECSYCPKGKEVKAIHFEGRYTTGELAIEPLDCYLCDDCIVIWEGWGCKFNDSSQITKN